MVPVSFNFFFFFFFDLIKHVLQHEIYLYILCALRSENAPETDSDGYPEWPETGCPAVPDIHLLNSLVKDFYVMM